MEYNLNMPFPLTVFAKFNNEQGSENQSCLRKHIQSCQTPKNTSGEVNADIRAESPKQDGICEKHVHPCRSI